jgi:predicted RNA-binding Zn-ribbon protein involved in translation (DUF1610 family)
MTGTEELVELKEFLDETVPCEGFTTDDHHAADIYVQFHCPECDEKIIGANCYACWDQFRSLAESAVMAPPAPCCRTVWWTAGDLSVLGPVR